MRALVTVLAGLLVAGGVAVAPPPGSGRVAQATPGAAISFDFDGDGYADLVAGIPGEDLKGVKDAGAVQVLYGSASGPTARDQVWHQGRKGVRDRLERADRFGETLASGDFDADGYADLAIGIPRENLGRKKDAGAVQVLYGGPRGLTARDQFWHQGSRGVPGKNEAGDRFGSNLAAGDVDGDGFADLVVGAPFEDLGRAKDAGTVLVLRGSRSGLTSVGAQVWNERSAGIGGTPRTDGFLGSEMAVGDVTGDGYSDLVLGVRGPQSGGDSIRLLPGSPYALTAEGSVEYSLSELGLESSWQLPSLWLGDVNADGREDLTVGASGVAVLHGHTDGLHPGPLAAPGQPGVDTLWQYDAATDTRFGGRGVTGDVTGDGFADLLMSVSRFQGDSGLVIVLGTSQGLGADSEEWMSWGSPPNLLPLSGGTTMWQVFGAYTLTVGPVYGAGTVTAVQPTPVGTGGTATMWSQDSPGIKGVAEPRDYFGQSVG